MNGPGPPPGGGAGVVQLAGSPALPPRVALPDDPLADPHDPLADPDDVLAIAAHELRQPASVIYGLSSTLVHLRGALSEEQLDEILRRLHRQAERLVSVLEDTLDLNRIRRAELTPTLSSIDLATAVDQALDVAPPPTGTHVSVTILPGLEVLAAAAGLERILVNLLSNAYRYGGPLVRVEGQPVPGGVRLSVADDGPGAPSDLVPHLFEPYRGQGGGHGLGLSIVLGLAESFGGTASYQPGDPARGGGAEFAVMLRNGAMPLPVSPANEPGPLVREPATILVVDDEPDIRWLLRLALETAGYRVVEAAHGEQALKAISSEPPTLLLSDLMMPVMDGNELSRRVRALEGSAGLPILVLSANPQLARDADRVLRKPCNIGELIRTVGELIGAAQSDGRR